MLLGVTALVLVASVFICREIYNRFPHDEMWSAIYKAISSISISSTHDLLDDNVSEKLLKVQSEPLEVNVEDKTTSSKSDAIVVPQLSVATPTLNFSLHDTENNVDEIVKNDSTKTLKTAKIIYKSQEDKDDDTAPSFPSLNSAQRASGGTDSLLNTSRNIPSFLRSMPPPPIPVRNKNSLANARKGLSPPSSGIALSDSGSSSSSSFGTPTQDSFLTIQRGGGSGNLSPSPTSSLALPPSATTKLQKPRKKVILEPGHSPLDWARLQQSGVDLRNVPFPHLIKVTLSELQKHNKDNDAWIVLDDKVYNATPYLAFHPGGGKEVMRIAGRDGTKLYMKTHPWVNYENMLKGCLIGMLVSESKMELESPLDDMD